MSSLRLALKASMIDNPAKVAPRSKIIEEEPDLKPISNKNKKKRPSTEDSTETLRSIKLEEEDAKDKQKRSSSTSESSRKQTKSSKSSKSFGKTPNKRARDDSDDSMREEREDGNTDDLDDEKGANESSLTAESITISNGGDSVKEEVTSGSSEMGKSRRNDGPALQEDIDETQPQMSSADRDFPMDSERGEIALESANIGEQTCDPSVTDAGAAVDNEIVDEAGDAVDDGAEGVRSVDASAPADNGLSRDVAITGVQDDNVGSLSNTDPVAVVEIEAPLTISPSEDCNADNDGIAPPITASASATAPLTISDPALLRSTVPDPETQTDYNNDDAEMEQDQPEKDEATKELQENTNSVKKRKRKSTEIDRISSNQNQTESQSQSEIEAEAVPSEPTQRYQSNRHAAMVAKTKIIKNSRPSTQSQEEPDKGVKDEASALAAAAAPAPPSRGASASSSAPAGPSNGKEAKEDSQHAQTSHDACQVSALTDTKADAGKGKPKIPLEENNDIKDSKEGKEGKEGREREHSSKRSKSRSSAVELSVPVSAPPVSLALVPPSSPAASTSNTSTSGVECGWVACDRCSKWRKLPPHVDTGALPEKWYCEMNQWDDAHSNCSHAEDSTDAQDKPGSATRGGHEAEVWASTPTSPDHRRSSLRAGGNDLSVRFSAVADGDDEKGTKEKDDERPGTRGERERRSSSKLRRGRGGPGAGARARGLGGRDADGGDDSDGGEPEGATGVVVLSAGPGRRRGSGRMSLGQSRAAALAQAQAQAQVQVASSASVVPGVAEVEQVNWVECTSCNKWRRVPSHINVADLPDAWICSNNIWAPNLARCSAKEETETDLAEAAAVVAVGKGAAGTRGRRGPAADSGAVLTQWVQCERRNCKKWRKIPGHVNTSQLPEKWYCEMNKWDVDRASCDGPEETDSEGETQQQLGNRSQLILATTGKSNSYRRIIFGTDGRVRLAFSEKSKNGYGIFSYTETSRRSGEGDDSAYVEPVRRLAYWWSGRYDEGGGSAFVSTSRRHPSSTAKDRDSASAKKKEGQADTTVGSLAGIGSGIVATLGTDVTEGPHADRGPTIPNSYLLDAARRLGPGGNRDAAPPTSLPQHCGYTAFGPKKLSKYARELQWMSCIDRMKIECRVVRSCLAAGPKGGQTIRGLTQVLRTARFHDLRDEACRMSAVDSPHILLMAVRRLEEQGEADVTLTIGGDTCVQLLPPPTGEDSCELLPLPAPNDPLVGTTWKRKGVPLKMRKEKLMNF